MIEPPNFRITDPQLDTHAAQLIAAFRAGPSEINHAIITAEWDVLREALYNEGRIPNDVYLVRIAELLDELSAWRRATKGTGDTEFEIHAAHIQVSYGYCPDHRGFHHVAIWHGPGDHDPFVFDDVAFATSEEAEAAIPTREQQVLRLAREAFGDTATVIPMGPPHLN